MEINEYKPKFRGLPQTTFEQEIRESQERLEEIYDEIEERRA